jgi:hypothetical protein
VTVASDCAQLTLNMQGIRTALQQKGVNIPVGFPLVSWPSEIAKMITGSAQTGWVVQGDWWPIQSILNTGNAPWGGGITIPNPRYALLYDDRQPTAVLPPYDCYMSDNHFVAGGGVTYTWDTTQDKPCSEGYSTRAVIVSSTSPNIAIAGTDVAFWAAMGNCNLTSLMVGSTSPTVNPNPNILAFTQSPQTTANPTGVIQGYAFAYCRNLRYVEVPNGTQTFAGSNTFMMQGGQSNLTDVIMPGGLLTMPSNQFYNAIQLRNIVIPASVTQMIGQTFFGCASLRTTMIPTLLTGTVNATMFAGCTALSSCELPSGWNFNWNISQSTMLSVSGMVQNIEAFADRSSTTALTYTVGATNLADLPQSAKNLAASKNITLA